MKPDEIMIGDWVMYDPNVFIEDEYEPNHPAYPVQIPSGEDIDLAIEGCYAPIPINEEILKKNGFERIDITIGVYVLRIDVDYDTNDCTREFYRVATYSNGGHFDEQFEIKNRTKGRYVSCYIKCKYVHELQHTLRICGLDELANGFKI